MKIEKGISYTCIKDVRMKYSDEIMFTAGETYRSPVDNKLTNEKGNEHGLSGEFVAKHFEPCEENVQGEIPNDPINPNHYKSYSVETIDMMIAIYGKEATAMYCEMTAFKYRQRLGKKDDVQQDLGKENWYLNKAKELRA